MSRNRTIDELEEQSELNFQNYLKEYGLVKFPIIGDGNCLFQSLSHQLEGNQGNRRWYRSMTIDYMVMFPDLFSCLLMDNDRFQVSLDMYLEYIAEDGRWGGNFEILALAEVFQVNIYVFHENCQRIKIGSQPDNDDDPFNSIFIAYSRS